MGKLVGVALSNPPHAACALRFVLEINVGERLPRRIGDDVGLGALLHLPRRRVSALGGCHPPVLSELGQTQRETRTARVLADNHAHLGMRRK
jgi:hypothetical protein